MHRLPLSFALLTCCGYWRPTKWPSSSLKYRLYNVYSAFMLLLLYSFSLCICIDTLISKNLKAMTDKFSLGISVLGVCFKVSNLFLQRGRIINVMNIFLMENFIPRDKQENIIQRRSDSYARSRFTREDRFTFKHSYPLCFSRRSLLARFFQETNDILRDPKRIDGVLRDSAAIQEPDKHEDVTLVRLGAIRTVFAESLLDILAVSNDLPADLRKHQRRPRNPDLRPDDTSWRAIRDILSSRSQFVLFVGGSEKPQRVSGGLEDTMSEDY